MFDARVMKHQSMIQRNKFRPLFDPVMFSNRPEFLVWKSEIRKYPLDLRALYTFEVTLSRLMYSSVQLRHLNKILLNS